MTVLENHNFAYFWKALILPILDCLDRKPWKFLPVLETCKTSSKNWYSPYIAGIGFQY